MSGVCVLDNGLPVMAFNLNNGDLWDKLTAFLVIPNTLVALEVIKPYSNQLDPYTVSTIEFIGEAKFRLRMACGENLRLVSRFDVKKWVFDSFPGVVLPLVAEKIGKKLFDACEILTKTEIRVTGKGRTAPKPTFVYVDDKIVSASMKWLYRLDKKNKVKGLSSHALQACAVASFVNSVNIAGVCNTYIR
jgi:hypothetical protein